MTITLELRPETEQRLRARADAQGVTVAEYVQEVLSREARGAEPANENSGRALLDAFSEVRGLLSDEEIEALFARNREPGREIDLS